VSCVVEPDEFEIIARYFTRSDDDAAVVLGIGDDAAVIEVGEPIVVTVDTLVGGVHFPPELQAHAVGYRALAVNVSDVASMGARPRWATLALTLPRFDADWLGDFASGFFELAERCGVDLVGGDTTRGPLTITVQLIGTLAGRQATTRGGGRVGDDVYVTGTLGDSAAAIPLFAAATRERTAAEQALLDRFGYPPPRVEAALALAPLVSAAIDVSDGLVADLGHICERSGCGARVDLEELPLSAALLEVCTRERAERFALSGGDDYELCFTAARGRRRAIEAALEAAGTPGRRIGELVEGHGVACCRAGRPVPIDFSGYRHF
jgi:thiamine-monophosphate kinase